MEPTKGAATFQTSGAAYDSFMGRYSRPLAVVFADETGVMAGQSALDVGCGPGALTGVIKRSGRPKFKKSGAIYAIAWDFCGQKQPLKMTLLNIK